MKSYTNSFKDWRFYYSNKFFDIFKFAIPFDTEGFDYFKFADIMNVPVYEVRNFVLKEYGEEALEFLAELLRSHPKDFNILDKDKEV